MKITGSSAGRQVLTGTGSCASGGSSIPQLSSDPASPSAEDAWVLRSGGGGSPIGLLLALTQTTPYTYQLSYRTIEGTTVRVSLT